LKSIVNSSYEKVQQYLEVVKEIVVLKEGAGSPLPRLRLDWIFGHGFLNYVSSGDDLRFGLIMLGHNIKDEVYQLKSMLTYDPDNDNSLLHLLWRYQGRMNTYAVNCLVHLTAIITSDESIMAYFATLPGVNYTYARYTDWIQPYLKE